MILLTKEKVIEVRAISTTFNQTRFDSFAKEAQDVHLRQFLGDALYYDLITNPTSASNVLLLNGEAYDLNGDTVQFFGLYTYLAYAWLFINAVEGDDFQSNIGTVNFNQQNQFTERPKGKSHTLKKYQDSIIIYRNNAIDYLNEKSDIYPLWRGNDKKKRGSYQIIHI